MPQTSSGNQVQSQCLIGGLQRAGGDNKLALVLGTYQPNVRCSGTLQSWLSCRDILFGMPATSENVVFGPSKDHHAQVTLPNILSSGKPLISKMLLFLSPGTPLIA